MTSKISKKMLLAISLAHIGLLIIFGMVYLLVFALARGDSIVSVSGRANSDFRVFYVDNSLYPANPISPNLHFLLSFTDFIELDSGFNATFSEPADIFYTYTATKRVIIRHAATHDENLNPIVFEAIYPLSNVQGHAAGSQFNIPGGTYTIFPRDYIDYYLYFVATHERMLDAEGLIVRAPRGFSAEIFVDFTYDIRVPDWDISETITNGYRIPISSEVFSPALTGVSPAFNDTRNIGTPGPRITLPMTIIYVAAFALGVYGLLTALKHRNAHPNPHRQKVLSLVKKYSDEMVVVSEPINKLLHTVTMQVSEFETLLNLAINQGKHILCYHCDEYATFVVKIDEYAYCFEINCAYADTSKEAPDAPKSWRSRKKTEAGS